MGKWLDKFIEEDLKSGKPLYGEGSKGTKEGKDRVTDPVGELLGKSRHQSPRPRHAESKVQSQKSPLSPHTLPENDRGRDTLKSDKSRLILVPVHENGQAADVSTPSGPISWHDVTPDERASLVAALFEGFCLCGFFHRCWGKSCGGRWMMM